ncbi:nuclear envelope integral membrane protein 1 [Drosophila nasuta]|uniref:nuclear envelope integral membrane protein 1 n=1 Tax=Drosophila nasuta TaxID=42062 RepID=UPI00295EC289|nr:nuclear envelope integral membrane protein 1 [Drosophila nasuta]
MLKLIVLQLLLASCSLGLFHDQPIEQMVIYLQPDEIHVQDALSMIQSIYTKNGVHIYCHNEDSLKIGNIFQTIMLQLITKEPNAKYAQYKAATPLGVHQAHLEGRECHEGKLMSGRTKTVHYVSLPAHAAACYGIYTDEAYNLTMLKYPDDGERSTWFVLGLMLWLSASLMRQNFSSCYVVAVALGLHFTGWGIVCGALILAGDYGMKSLQPVSTNFKLVLERYPTSVALILVFAAWLMFKLCEAYQTLWRFKYVQQAYFRLLRGIAYYLIFNASDHKYFGWICVAMLLPQPELYRFVKRLRDETIRARRTWFPPRARTLLTEEEFEAQTRLETRRALSQLRQQVHETSPSWEQMAHLQTPCRFVRFMGSADQRSEENTVNEEMPENCRTTQPNVELLEHLTTAINNSCSTPSVSSTGAHNQNRHYSRTMRSLRAEPR